MSLYKPPFLKTKVIFIYIIYIIVNKPYNHLTVSGCFIYHNNFLRSADQ